MDATNTTTAAARIKFEALKASLLRSLSQGQGLVVWNYQNATRPVKGWLSVELSADDSSADADGDDQSAPARNLSAPARNLVFKTLSTRKRQEGDQDQPATIQIILWTQVAAVCRSVMVEGALWLIGADHSSSERRLKIRNLRFRLDGESNTPLHLDALAEVLRSEGRFDNRILTNLIPTHVSTMTLESAAFVGSITDSQAGLLGASEDPETSYSIFIDGSAFSSRNPQLPGGAWKAEHLGAFSRLSEIGSKVPLLSPVFQFLAVVVATYESVQGLKSDFLELLQRWESVERNLQGEESLRQSILRLAEDFFFKWPIQRGLAYKDFETNVVRLRNRKNDAVLGRTLDVVVGTQREVASASAKMDLVSESIASSGATLDRVNENMVNADKKLAAIGDTTAESGKKIHEVYEEMKEMKAMVSRMSLFVDQAASTAATTAATAKAFVWTRVESMLPPKQALMGRLDDMEVLRLLLQEPGTIIALTGVAGCGKSHLARNSAREWKKVAPDGIYRIVLVVNAESDSSCRASYIRIAKRLGFDLSLQENGKVVPTEELARRIHLRIAEAPNDIEFLIILDNAPVSEDGPDILNKRFGPDDDRPWSRFPVILTSQSNLYDGETSLGGIDMVVVDPLPSDISMDLLMKNFSKMRKEQNEISAAKELVNDFLHNLPVAILAVAGLVKMKGWTFQGYLKRLNVKEVNAGVDSVHEVLQDALAEARRELGLARVLDVAAFVCPDDIPLSLLGDEGDLVGQLCLLNLLQVASDGMYSMHRLVQGAARKTRSPSAATLALSVTFQSFKYEDHATWAAAVTLLPHVEALRSVANADRIMAALQRDDWLQYWNLSEDAGLVYRNVLSDFQSSLRCHLDSWTVAQAEYGENTISPGIASTLANLGRTYDHLGDPVQAKHYHEQAKESYKQALVLCREVVESADNSSICESLRNEVQEAGEEAIYNLGVLCQLLGQDKEAKEYFEEALVIYQRRPGSTSDKSKLAKTLGSLGRNAERLGDSVHAKGYYEQALNMYGAVFGRSANHPKIADTLAGLGDVNHSLGHYYQARDYHLQALRMRRALHGEAANDSGIADSLSQVASCCDALDDYEQAKYYNEQALAMGRAVWGESANNKAIALSLHNLGLAHKGLGNYAQAQFYLEQALAMRRVLNEAADCQLSIAKTLYSLGLTQLMLDATQKGRDYLEEALATFRAVYGETAIHLKIEHTLGNLGLAAQNLGDYAQAKNYQEQCLAMARALEGPTANVERIADTLVNLSFVHQDLRDYEEGIRYMEEALAMYRIVYRGNERHPQIQKGKAVLADMAALALFSPKRHRGKRDRR